MSTTSFEDLGITGPLLYVIRDQKYKCPTPIQQKVIPPLLAGQDILASSQTGSGKTAAFALPILQRLSQGKKAKKKKIRTLILCPTRELACQIDESFKRFALPFSLDTLAVFGGVKINPQMSALGRGVDILTATPGRLLDLYEKKALSLASLEFLVLDEVDRMLNLGFSDEVNHILAHISGKPQSLLFSATISAELKNMAVKLLNNPRIISLSQEFKKGDAPPSIPEIEQWVYPVDQAQKPSLLIHLLKKRKGGALIFTRTKNGADRLVRRLEKAGIKSRAIHGDKSQGARTRALGEFKAGVISVLVATDLAARGLDISNLPLVVNYDLPHLKEDYVHRIGRTGRAGAGGTAISLVCAQEFSQLALIERLTQQVISRKELEDYSPQEALPPSHLDLRPFKPKKPKKNKMEKKNESL